MTERISAKEATVSAELPHFNSRHSASALPAAKPDWLHADSFLPRIAMISTHGYVSAHPPLGAADTGGQVVYVLELSKKLAQLGYEVDIWTRQFEDQSELEFVAEHVRIIRVPCGGSSQPPW